MNLLTIFYKENNMSLVTLTTQNYTILVHPSLLGLSREADDIVKIGWVPLGGPASTPSGKFMQAFTKAPAPEPVKKSKK